MNAILRTTLIGAASLVLTAAPALGQVKQSKTDVSTALHMAQKELAIVQESIAVVEQRIGMVRKQIAAAESMAEQTGDPYFKLAVDKLNTSLASLQAELERLHETAKQLQAKIAALTAMAARTQLSSADGVESQPGTAVFSAPQKSSKTSKKGK